MLFRAFTFGVAATVGISLGIWTIDRDVPTVTLRVEVVNDHVPPGGKLRVHYWVKRYRDCAIKIDRVLKDSEKTRVVLSDLDFSRAPGPLGEDDYVSEVDVPETFAQGPAIYTNVISYNCNPVHRWFWPIITGPHDVSFTIDGSPPDYPTPPELRQQMKPLR